MNAVLDHVLAAAAITLSSGYAFTHLAPRGLKLRALRLLARLLGLWPAAKPLEARTLRRVQRLAQVSACGGCGTCADDKDAKSGNEVQRISPRSIGRRSR
jgi:hypothetical protein